MFNVLFPKFDNVTRFAQIYIIGFIQETLKRRMNSNIDDDVLNEIVLFRLQRLFKKNQFLCQKLENMRETKQKF